MGRVAAVLYAPLMKGRVLSWDPRLKGRSVLDLNKILSSFFDELDPMSEPACLSIISLCICTNPKPYPQLLKASRCCLEQTVATTLPILIPSP